MLAERAAGRSGEGSARVLATWVAHVRSSNEIDDVARAQIVESASGTLADAAPRLLGLVSATLDDDVAALVATQVAELEEDRA